MLVSKNPWARQLLGTRKYNIIPLNRSKFLDIKMTAFLKCFYWKLLHNKQNITQKKKPFSGLVFHCVFCILYLPWVLKIFLLFAETNLLFLTSTGYLRWSATLDAPSWCQSSTSLPTWAPSSLERSSRENVKKVNQHTSYSALAGNQIHWCGMRY